eukprot:10656953-Ditylum_brightwellii.AAC.1
MSRDVSFFLSEVSVVPTSTDSTPVQDLAINHFHMRLSFFGAVCIGPFCWPRSACFCRLIGQCFTG